MKKIMETLKVKDYWYMLASFLFTLVIPIFFLLCYHSVTYKISKKLVEDSNQKIINNATVSIDTTINNLKLTFDKLFFEADVNLFINNKMDYKGSSDIYIVKNAKKTLDKYVHYFDKNFMCDIMIFNPKNSTIVSRELDYADLSVLYSSVYKFGDYNYEEFCELLSKLPSKGQFLPDNFSTVKNKSNNVITYVRPILGESNQHTGYLISHINTQELISKFSALNYGDTGYFIIRDLSGKILFSTHPLNSSTSLNANDFYISKKSNPYSEFSYELGLPKKYIAQTINPTRNLFVLYVLLSVILGIALSFFLSYLRIKPISELFNCFEPGQQKHEINKLSAGLHKIIEENSDIKIKLSEQFVLAKYELINRIFLGDIDKDDYFKISETLDCPTEGYCYVVLNISDKNSDQKNNLFLPATETALTNSGFEKHFMLPYKGKSVSCFVCFESNSLKKLSSMLENLTQILLSVGGFSSSVFTGSIVHNLQDVARSKDEADFLFINIEKHGIFIHDLISGSCNFHYPIKTETNLIKSITEGNAKNVGDILDNLFASNFNDKIINFTVYQRFVEGIINTFYRIDNALFSTYKTKIHSIEQINSIKRSCVELRQLAFLVTEQFIVECETQQDSLKGEIMNYVKEQYCDSCFTILELADKFNMSYDCMYNYFKKNYSKTFSSIVEDMRMEKSTRLLKQDENIDTIAKLCGYNSSHSFRRTFTKKYGITPSVYRENLSKK